MADERILDLDEFLKEIRKAQKEIGATRNSNLSVIAMHNGLTLATALAYKVALTKGNNNG